VDLRVLLLPEALLVILDRLVQQSLIKLQVLLVGLLVDLLPEGLSAILDRLVQQSLTEPQQQALTVGLLEVALLAILDQQVQLSPTEPQQLEQVGHLLQREALPMVDLYLVALVVTTPTEQVQRLGHDPVDHVPRWDLHPRLLALCQSRMKAF
jgi:hypothetical protein